MFGFFKKVDLPKRTLSEIKQICNILFIDDRKFSVIDILKGSGWNNTQRLSDIDSIDQSEIANAHILFVDILGVGKKLAFSDEGLGLILALKEKYPWKKIVVYSSEPTGDRFHEALSQADARLRKDADPYQFQNILEKLAKELFSLPDTIERVRALIAEETGLKPTQDEVIKVISKSYKNDNFDPAVFSRKLNLQNASAIASIVQLFLSGGSNS